MKEVEPFFEPNTGLDTFDYEEEIEKLKRARV